MNDEEKVLRARKQLIIVGVVCVTVVLFVIWLINLPRTFARNRETYSSPIQTVKTFLQRYGR